MTLEDRLTTLGLVPWGTPVVLDGPDAVALATTAPHTGLAALLGAAVELGAVLVDDAARDVVRSTWTDRLTAVVTLDVLLARVVTCLRDADIPTRALKGAAVASLDDVEPAWRTYGDVDVLVPSDRLLDAVDALGGLGLRPAVAPVARDWTARHAKSVTLVDARGLQVDLHRTLASGPFGARLRTACLFESSRTFSVGGVAVDALGDVDRFCHAAYHAALGGLRGPRHLRDVLLLARQVTPDDVEARLAADGWSIAVLCDALGWARTSGALPDTWSTWCDRQAPDPADTALVTATRSGFRTSARAQLRETQGIVGRMRFLAALVWPHRDNLRARGLDRRSHLRTLVTRRHQDGAS